MRSGKDRYKRAEGGFYEGGEGTNMRGIHGTYTYSKTQLAEICNLDNHHTADLKDYPSMRLSSQMIIERYGGQEGIMKALFTNSKTGIEGSAGDIKDRQRIYGPNSFPPPEIKGIMELILENFEDPINKVLLAAALVSLVIGLYKEGFPEGLIEGTSIAIALVIICSVTSVNNWFSEKRLADLVALSDKKEVAVYRGSDKITTLDSTELVVGDLVRFAQGDKIPADMMMVEGQDVTCNESELTGEPDSLEKTPVNETNYRDGNMSTMLAKSLCDNGNGKAIVMAVGEATVAGVITLKTQQAPEPTLLQKKLEVMAGKIGDIGMAVAILTFLASVVRIGIEAFKILPCGCMNLFVCQQPIEGTCEMYDFQDLNNEVYPMLLEAVIIGITVVVVAIPEGLPLAVTISLSFASSALLEKQNLVRKIASAETMGGATHICSDKTGTLTQNKMTVMATFSIEKCIQTATSSNEEVIQMAKNTFQSVKCNGQTIWDTLIEGILWNSSAWIEKDKISDDYEPKGNVTEKGIFQFFMDAIGPTQCVSKKTALKPEHILCEVPFTSKRKMASIVVRQADKINTDKEVRVYTKGAPDMLLQKVTYSVVQNGTIQPIDKKTTVPKELLKDIEQESGAQDSYRGLYDRTVKKFADQAYRTILVSYKDMSMREFQKLKNQSNQFAKDADRSILETDLIAVGIFGLQDPLRPTIVDSVRQCKEAGIQVIMCTGDNIDTAIAISKNAGIVTKEEIDRNEFAAMTGKQFREAVGGLKKMQLDGKEIDVVGDMNKFREIKKQLKVLARSSPEDKYILVTGIQDSEGVVAVTGDGTNDAPALTKADVGFSMGITGTDVAQGASDIVLMDDDFSSIIVALQYGRNVYDNVRKFLQFQLTVNFVAMFIVFLGAVVTKKSPLNAVQMLWVNLIMDTFAALALATEPPPKNILKRAPLKKDDPIITKVMGRNVQGHAIYQCVILLVILFAGPTFLLDYQYETQCVEYIKNNSTGEQECNTHRLNPFYTKSEYYDPLLWQPIVEKNQPELYKFDKVLLYRWRCNLFTQDNFHYSDAIERIGLCYLEHPHEQFTNPMLYTQWMESKKLNDQDKKIIKEFAESGWMTVFPFTQAPEVSNGQKIYSSQGFNTEETKLFSFVFNAFVFMQVFNQINARKLEAGEWNVFSGIFENFMFIVIVLLTIAVQLAMVEYGGRMVKCWPLNMYQNLICIALGAGELIWAFVVKLIPETLFCKLGLEGKNVGEGERKVPLSIAIKKGSRAK